MRIALAILFGLFLGSAAFGCETYDKPDVPLASPAGPRVTPQSTDFATFVTGLIATQTLESSAPAKLDAVLFDNTQDPHAFDELFAE